MIDTKAARELADKQANVWTPIGWEADVANMLRQCADEIDALNEEVQRLKIWQSQMVEKAADKSLAGYRELADTCARLSEEIDALRGQALSDPEREEYFALKADAAQFRAQERERCAKVCEDLQRGYAQDEVSGTDCAEAIREIGDE